MTIAQTRTWTSRATERFASVASRGGVFYAILYGLRVSLERISDVLDRGLVRVEQRRDIVEPWAISSRRFTAEHLRSLYNAYDWSQRGEEWTRDDTWKQSVVDELLVPFVPSGAVAVEIGPGGGRWTEYLQRRASRLYLIDVAEKAIRLCHARFATCDNIEYILGDGRSIAVPSASIDVIWSFDVFVHVNPLDARAYIAEFDRVLKPGGRAVVHHPGDRAVPIGHPRPGGRSDLTNRMVLDFARRNGLKVLRQAKDERHPDDVVTILRKPTEVS